MPSQTIVRLAIGSDSWTRLVFPPPPPSTPRDIFVTVDMSVFLSGEYLDEVESELVYFRNSLSMKLRMKYFSW